MPAISTQRSIWRYGKVRDAFSWLIRNRKFQITDAARQAEYLNIGCGPFPLEGFCNIDYDWIPGVFCFDITQGIPWPDAGVRGIFTEHCLEHISYANCLKVLRDFRRMLKPGGVARIAVPDAGYYCDLYMRAQAGESIEWPYPEAGKLPVYYLNRIMRDYGHQFLYDFDGMREAMLAAGFRDVHRASFRSGADPQLLVDREYRAVETLYVEGTA